MICGLFLLEISIYFMSISIFDVKILFLRVFIFHISWSRIETAIKSLYITWFPPCQPLIDVVPSSGIGMDNYNYNMHLKPSCIEKVSQILCQENKPCFIALYSTYGILRLFNQSTPVLELFLSLRTVLEFSIFFQSLWSMQKHVFFIASIAFCNGRGNLKGI